MRELSGAQQKSIQKELIPDGNRRKPPISNVQQQLSVGDPDNNNDSTVLRPLSTVSSDGLTVMDDIEDIDDDITTTASESYAQEDSSSNEGNQN